MRKRLPRHHVRLPDERPRLGADQGHARVARARRGALAGERRRARLQHLHDPREAGHEARRVPRRRGRAQAARPRARDRRRRLLRRGAAGAHLRALPAGRRRLRAGLDPAPRRLDRRRRTRRRAAASARTSTSPATCRCTASARFSAWVQVSMGCNSKCSYCIVPAVRGREQSRRPGEIVAEVTQLAADGVKEITLLGQNVNSWGRDLRPDLDTEFGELLRACDAVAGIERIRFTSPHPKDFREPGDRGDRRVRRGLRAHPPAAPVGLEPDPQGDAPHLRPRALPDARRRSCATRSPASRSAPTSSSASRARPRTTSGRRSRWSRRCATTARSRSSTRRATAPRRPRCPTRSPTRSSTSGSSGSSRSCSGSRPSGTPSASARVEEVLVEGPSRTDATLLRGRTRRNTTVNFTGDAAPGELVDVEIAGATSTTLRGAQRTAVAA